MRKIKSLLRHRESKSAPNNVMALDRQNFQKLSYILAIYSQMLCSHVGKARTLEKEDKLLLSSVNCSGKLLSMHTDDTKRQDSLTTASHQ